MSLPCLLMTELALTATAVVIADAKAIARKAKNHNEMSTKADRRPLKKKETSDAKVARRSRPAAIQYSKNAAFCATRRAWTPSLTASGQCRSSRVMFKPVLFNSCSSAVVGLNRKKEVRLLQYVMF